MIKMTGEAIAAFVAVGITAVGAIAATAVSWGSTTDQIQQVDKRVTAVEATQSKIERIDQKIDDVITRLDRMEKNK